jgi:hypothetical protein
MKTINLKGISGPLSERELKNVKGGLVHLTVVPNDPPMADDGGNGTGTGECYNLRPCDAGGDCMGRVCGEDCVQKLTGRMGKCMHWLCHGNFLGLPTEYGTVCGVGFK